MAKAHFAGPAYRLSPGTARSGGDIQIVVWSDGGSECPSAGAHGGRLCSTSFIGICAKITFFTA
eukprot:4284299-Prorocentrum_lima.AAC.1